MAAIDRLHPAASDADSLVVSSGVAAVSGSPQKPAVGKIVMQRCIFTTIVRAGVRSAAVHCAYFPVCLLKQQMSKKKKKAIKSCSEKRAGVMICSREVG